MIVGLLIAALQIGTSLARLAGFAFAVLTIGRIGGDPNLLLVIGYLPYLAFFDILIQSGSRAMHLQGGPARSSWAAWRAGYAMAALAAIGACIMVIASNPAARYLLVLGAWPLGALGFIWERWIARRNRQVLLSTAELTILAAAVGVYLAGLASWSALLLCIVSAPLARLAVLALPNARAQATETTGAEPIVDGPPASRRRLGGYVAASLAQQLLGASAASLPALYAQAFGDYRGLSVNLAAFRSLHSLAAVLSLSINAMSSRIFYRQMGGAFASMERLALGKAAPVAVFACAATIAAAVIAILQPSQPVLFSAALLPIMAAINTESSMLYNRGLPFWTMHCQAMILLLSAAFLAMLTGYAPAALVALAVFLGYGALAFPRMINAHRQEIAYDRIVADA